MKKIEEFSLELLYNDDEKVYVISYISLRFTDIPNLFNNLDKIRITKIHAVIFDYFEEEDIFINEENIGNYIDNIDYLDSIVDFFANLEQEYTINKFEFIIDEIEVFYDDDSQIVISISEDNSEKVNELLRKIFQIQQNNPDETM